jgi:hypothetical protein
MKSVTIKHMSIPEGKATVVEEHAHYYIVFYLECVYKVNKFNIRNKKCDFSDLYTVK